ncbi:uncharacterized protein N0V89_002347 [Didymosphaeria variabile]|uniref:Uncharacterized protein n=1 Tax=Didymosphaeria variabile TaxID=1932322 RepID=A0A9W9CDI1_9PLEO|nr:uncharacterized protein N0V89_002347 [Didymosphaeria variabile]KAJ4357771.1 hypothetical protein N0V89_002347 [Didymosphaeria variabile]
MLRRPEHLRVEEFVDLIRTKYLSSEAGAILVDLVEKIQYLTLDVTSGLAFGKTFGMLQKNSDVDDYRISDLGRGVWPLGILPLH